MFKKHIRENFKIPQTNSPQTFLLQKWSSKAKTLEREKQIRDCLHFLRNPNRGKEKVQWIDWICVDEVVHLKVR